MQKVFKEVSVFPPCADSASTKSVYSIIVKNADNLINLHIFILFYMQKTGGNMHIFTDDFLQDTLMASYGRSFFR